MAYIAQIHTRIPHLFFFFSVLSNLMESIRISSDSFIFRADVCHLRLRGGTQAPKVPDLWDSDSYEPEHRFLHPDQLMLDESFDNRANISDLEKLVMNRTRIWMRELVRREEEDKADPNRPPYVDVSDIRIDSEEYKYFDNVSNPHRYDYGSVVFRTAFCRTFRITAASFEGRSPRGSCSHDVLFASFGPRREDDERLLRRMKAPARSALPSVRSPLPIFRALLDRIPQPPGAVATTRPLRNHGRRARLCECSL